MKRILLWWFSGLLFFLSLGSFSNAALATTVLVNEIGDSLNFCSLSGNGTCTLRDAITFLNNNPGTGDEIDFADSLCSSGCTIAPAAALPDITDPNWLFINGYSVTGSNANTLAMGNDAVLKVVLDGTGAGDTVSGLRIATNGCLIRGLVIHNFGGTGFGNGIRISGGSGNRIEGNFLGTDASGTAALRTLEGSVLGTKSSGTAALGNTDAGVSLLNGATGNTVGGSSLAARNLISGN